MEAGKKKVIMIVIIVACLVVAGIITYSTSSRTPGGIKSLEYGEMIWLKCRNPDCEHTWQMDMRDYYTYVEENRIGMTVPAVVCPKCGEDSGYLAIKCPKCGFIFERGSVPNDIPDRCPECGFSATEESRKSRREK